MFYTLLCVLFCLKKFLFCCHCLKYVILKFDGFCHASEVILGLKIVIALLPCVAAANNNISVSIFIFRVYLPLFPRV